MYVRSGSYFSSRCSMVTSSFWIYSPKGVYVAYRTLRTPRRAQLFHDLPAVRNLLAARRGRDNVDPATDLDGDQDALVVLATPEWEPGSAHLHSLAGRQGAGDPRCVEQLPDCYHFDWVHPKCFSAR